MYGNDINPGKACDQTLQQIARLLRDYVRPGDIVARWGCEEFAVALPGADLFEAEAIAEQIAYPSIGLQVWVLVCRESIRSESWGGKSKCLLPSP